LSCEEVKENEVVNSNPISTFNPKQTSVFCQIGGQESMEKILEIFEKQINDDYSKLQEKIKVSKQEHHASSDDVMGLVEKAFKE
jgi:hypothetical protein